MWVQMPVALLRVVPLPWLLPFRDVSKITLPPGVPEWRSPKGWGYFGACLPTYCQRAAS